ncbi:MAG: DUF1566 domain-containing protein [Archangium sp.]|nr:DUF1566 domain-containing protein [Archangium sp.]
MTRRPLSALWLVIAAACAQVPSTATTPFFCRTSADCATGVTCVNSVCGGAEPIVDACAAPEACVDAEWAQWPVPSDGPRSATLVASAETVRDTVTGLRWLRQTAPMLATAEAPAWCKAAVGDGLTGWRVPTMAELLTLVDVLAPAPPLIDVAAFPETPASRFLTASTYAPAPWRWWTVSFEDGTTTSSDAAVLDVRCVR